MFSFFYFSSFCFRLSQASTQSHLCHFSTPMYKKSLLSLSSFLCCLHSLFPFHFLTSSLSLSPGLLSNTPHTATSSLTSPLRVSHFHFFSYTSLPFCPVASLHPFSLSYLSLSSFVSLVICHTHGQHCISPTTQPHPSHDESLPFHPHPPSSCSVYVHSSYHSNTPRPCLVPIPTLSLHFPRSSVPTLPPALPPHTKPDRKHIISLITYICLHLFCMPLPRLPLPPLVDLRKRCSSEWFFVGTTTSLPLYIYTYIRPYRALSQGFSQDLT